MARPKGNKERREFWLTPVAQEVLERLSEANRCNYSDVIEALLLGAVNTRMAAINASNDTAIKMARCGET